ncbi:MAG: PBP1A family penicillin-binding protein [Acidobacteriota bacterium]
MTSHRTSSPGFWSRSWPWLLGAVVALLLVAFFLAWPFWRLSAQFGAQPSRQPSRLYARPMVVAPGSALSSDALATALEAAGYRATEQVAGPGQYRVAEGVVELHRRRFSSPRGPAGGDRLRFELARGRIARVVRDDRELRGVWLDPPLLASYYDDDFQERRPVAIEELPEHLVLAVLAAEDARFLEHPGVSLRGILRAAWVNLQANAVRQGGSTLTQQLVKNLYLTHERRWGRKAQEAVLALMLEARYPKRDILEAYLNEIYWGRAGRVELMGIGAAAWAYFHKRPSELTLAESATLAGMIQSPGNLSPFGAADACKARRDVVLGRLAELEWIPPRELALAAAETLAPRRGLEPRRLASHFKVFVEGEAERRFGVTDLASSGYALHSTLDLRDQQAAEEAVAWGLEALETGWEKDRNGDGPLEAVLVSLEPFDGAIRAYVGGRDFRRSQFDRVHQAERQAGSAFKPVIFTAALEQRRVHAASLIDDSPFTVELAGRRWSPQNSDGRHRGPVTARVALEQSLNVPTARLALSVGLDAVVDMARRLGIRRQLEPLPALALGAMEVPPIDLANVYATLAAGGLRHEPHGLDAVVGPDGSVLEAPLPPPTQVVAEDVAFVVTRLLQGVVERGTARRGVREAGLRDPVAGKTGTTNGRRDSWFAGYSPERVSLVWVGYDDNRATNLSGARAAVPIWSRFSYAVRPSGGYRDLPQPASVVETWIDPRTGGLAHGGCSQRQPEVFLRDDVPPPDCADDDFLRRGWPRDDGFDRDRGDRGGFRDWLDRMRRRIGGRDGEI